MMTKRRFDGGGSARKDPPRRGHRPARPWILIALTLAALGLEGCQSLQSINPFNACNRGKCGLGRRLFARPAAVESCEPGGCEAGGISAGVPIETLPGPGSVITTPAPGALGQPPPADVEVPDLAPAEPAPPAGSGTSSTRGTDKSSYQTTLREGSRLSRRPSATRGHYTPPRPDPTPPRGDESSPAVQLLDSLPPPAEELKTEATSGVTSPPRATAAEATPEPTTPTTPEPSPPPAVSQEEGAPAAAAAPGIRRFKVVEPQLAGGSFPADPGWDWLVEAGYKTVLDLREPSEVRPQEIAAIDHRGLRHVALPIAPETIDAARVDRFRDEIAQAGARPLFFCDTDGARAAVLWYIRRVGFDKIDPDSARREAEELGRIDPKLWGAAETYLGRLNPPPSASPAAAAVTEPPPPQAASTPTPAPAEPAPPPPGSPASAIPADPTAWRPYGALLLTVLAVPLAYWSRTGLTFRARPRASLPGSVRRPRSLPPASGA
jgi:protein tyrosine phosphatase (PTP) superfamily phosphohydrolase (DUF442 family)